MRTAGPAGDLVVEPGDVRSVYAFAAIDDESGVLHSPSNARSRPTS
jgi:hypothetical protein